ncbi:MAG: 2-amino-4-hydroxy-6-hydroxymethyldihydropteridine diphosphokinase [Muribaculaceae bacterium]|nr:2-amino-4-hydroxy-6-hydroxymethyldihydropteridine diphosphokinase [Muribaculaceae bacterium]
MTIAYINIGSNKGDRRTLTDRAVAMIEQTLGATACRAPLYQSPAWGYESDMPYLNLGITIPTSLSPETLLATLHRIEQTISTASHRDTDGSYIDREIDIDLICLGDTVARTPELTLPHPRMHLRQFVLVPMAALIPGWRHPVTGLTPADMIRDLV